MKQCFDILNTENHTAVLHCAAGIHRTGTIGYTLLRLNGMEATEAFESLKVMREETYKGVGDWWIKLAEDHLVPFITASL